jgi:hypothetical protein
MNEFDDLVEFDFIDEIAEVERLFEKKNAIKQVDWLEDFERRIKERYGDVASNLLNNERKVKGG